MSKEDKPKSRWNAGNPRYTKEQQSVNDKLLRGQHGWRNGARVWKK